MANLSLRQIRNEIEKLKVQAAQIEKQERSAAIETIKSLITEFNLSASDIGLGRPKKSAPQSDKRHTAVRYRKGDLTWSGGRGVKPKWVYEIIAKQGLAALEKYRVEEL